MNNAFPTNIITVRGTKLRSHAAPKPSADPPAASPRATYAWCIPLKFEEAGRSGVSAKKTRSRFYFPYDPGRGFAVVGASRERARSPARDGAGARGLRYASDDSCLIDTYMVKQGARSRRAVSKTSVRTTRRRTGGTGVREHERARRRETRRVAPGGVGGRSVTSGARARIRGKPSSRRSRGASSRRAHPSIRRRRAFSVALARRASVGARAGARGARAGGAPAGRALRRALAVTGGAAAAVGARAGHRERGGVRRRWSARKRVGQRDVSESVLESVRPTNPRTAGFCPSRCHRHGVASLRVRRRFTNRDLSVEGSVDRSRIGTVHSLPPRRHAATRSTRDPARCSSAPLSSRRRPAALTRGARARGRARSNRRGSTRPSSFDSIPPRGRRRRCPARSRRPPRGPDPGPRRAPVRRRLARRLRSR